MAAQLRVFQRRIVDSIGRSNAIVMLPTGSGKTIISAKIVSDHLTAKNTKALFLVPTQDLVDQQAQVIRTWCPQADVLQFTGGMGDPKMTGESKACLVSTPKAFLHLQQRKNLFGWPAFGLVVFDEVHHVLKDHPYRHLALRIKEFLENDLNSSHSIQVLGLSASLTYAVNDRSIKKTLGRVCHELKIEKMISPSVAELVDGGYVSQHGRNVEVEQVSKLPKGLIPRTERKPHEMHRQFMQRVQTKNATDFAQAYWTVVMELENQVKREIPKFTSPLHKLKLSSWAEYTRQLSASRNSNLLKVLQHWYVGLRLLVQTWEEEQALVLAWLSMNNAFKVNIHDSAASFHYLKSLATNQANFLKLNRLHFHLKDKREMKGDAFRCLVFTQQRISSVILSHFINSDPELQRLGITSEFVTARGSLIAPGITVTTESAKIAIENFRSGAINVIVCTSVLEEGFDVPAANVVISYDHLKDSVELCQRFGRARHEESSIVVLDERRDRPVEMLESVRNLQETIAQEYNPSTSSSGFSPAEEEAKQRDRERNANQSVLFNLSKQEGSPVATLHLYVKKTKAVLEESCSPKQPFVVTMSYRSILRSISGISHEGSNKKEARKNCAAKMLQALRAEMR